ncbi:MAG: hypothetical protein V3S25_00660 [Nitrospirales bacterium]
MMIRKDGILQTVTQDELDAFIKTMPRADLVTALHQSFYEIGRLKIAAGETEPEIHV